MWWHSFEVEHDVAGERRDCRSSREPSPAASPSPPRTGDALSSLANSPLTLPVWTFQFAQAHEVELGQEFLARGDADATKCASKALVNVRHEGDAAIGFRFVHAPLR